MEEIMYLKKVLLAMPPLTFILSFPVRAVPSARDLRNLDNNDLQL